jgi:hypothetical protein
MKRKYITKLPLDMYCIRKNVSKYHFSFLALVLFLRARKFWTPPVFCNYYYFFSLIHFSTCIPILTTLHSPLSTLHFHYSFSSSSKFLVLPFSNQNIFWRNHRAGTLLPPPSFSPSKVSFVFRYFILFSSFFKTKNPIFSLKIINFILLLNKKNIWSGFISDFGTDRVKNCVVY